MDFLFRKPTIKATQKFIDKLQPKVNVHVGDDLPMPSIRRLRKVCENVARVNALEEAISRLSDAQLQAKTDEFKSIYEQKVTQEKKAYLDARHELHHATRNEDKERMTLQMEKAKENYMNVRKRALDELLAEAFAVVRETGKRVVAMRHFDVQLIGGMVLHDGNIAEMTTGEGKTLVATLPAYLNALTGEGVHVVTVNDYLAKRDCEWMGPIHQFLGLTVGVIQHDMMPEQRKGAYNCDITYGTNNEFGFDYLRDNMVNFKEDMVQREHHFAVVDEVDSILVDEARTPLIISGPAEASTDKYYRANEIAKKLKGRKITERDEIDAKHSEEGIAGLSKGFDYLADEKAKSISLTENGEEKVAEMFGVPNLHDMETIEYRHHILSALRAKEFFVKDVDYVVKEGQVIIVDEFTGRMMPGRRWSDGLHQAVEAKEGIKIERENQTLASITFQNYFRLYDKLSGMTGTAYTEATEFKQIYNLDCVAVPTNKRLQRKNYADCIYKTKKEKFEAVVNEVEEHFKRGQPVLVGTISIEGSELLSSMFTQRGIKHQVLNAKFHEMEANIISQAGRLNGVTIATNMAGRGTDIVLGGNAEFLAKSLEQQSAKEKSNEVKDNEIATEKFIQQLNVQCKEEHDKVIELGGLHVLGTERHESRRIDNQLRGRQGRQGDPGSSRFYVSLQDDLMRLFASDRIIGMMDKLGMEEGQVLEHPWLSKALENAQKRVEGHNFEIRKHLLEYDNVMNRQREVVYGLRRSVLESDNVKHMIREAIEVTIEDKVDQYLFNKTPLADDFRSNSESDVTVDDDSSSEDGMTENDDGVDFEGFRIYLNAKFNFDFKEDKDSLMALTQDEITKKLTEQVLTHYEYKEKDMDADHLRYLERMLMLHTIDLKWKDHLYAMDQLKDGIGLRSYGQRDPLLEYKKEGFEMFQAMYTSIYHEVSEVIFKIQPAGDRPSLKLSRSAGVFSSIPQKLIHEEASGISSIPASPVGQSQSQASADRPAPAQRSPARTNVSKTGRNDPCPCGSGKKYKKCCGA